MGVPYFLLCINILKYTNNNFGSNFMYVFVIKPLRKSRNITLYGLSKSTGISRTYLRNLENNKVFNPTMKILDKIANALDVTIKDLFYYDNDVNKLKECRKYLV